MQILLQFLGFTTTSGIIWNTLAYIAFVGIIIGVYWEKYRNSIITMGALILMFYASTFLNNRLFEVLQMLIVISGILQLISLPKKFSIGILTLVTIAALNLLLGEIISNIWAFIGSLGLLGMAFGLIILPKRFGFLVMAMGGAFLTIYAFTVAAWVFFFLNAFFAVSNIVMWHKNK